MKRIIALILCVISIFTLASCSSQDKYDFQYAFFEIELEPSGEEVSRDIDSKRIDQSYIDRVNELFVSLTSYMNERFDLNLAKPLPDVKAYSPDWGANASYLDDTLYINVDIPVTDDILIHELIHYLSDNGGNKLGFIHNVEHNGHNISVGRGFNEGFTDILTVMYCTDNGISLPPNVLDSTDMYSDNRALAQAYFMLNEETVTWYFNSDHQSMTNFVLDSLNAVANVPENFSDKDTFDLFFYIYQDFLLEYGIGSRTDVEGYILMYTSSFEIASITVRNCPDRKLKKQI